MSNITPVAWYPWVPGPNSKYNPRYNAFAKFVCTVHTKKSHILTTYRERNIQFRGAAQQFTSQMSPSNFSDPAPGMSAPPMDVFRDSQSTPAAAHALSTGPPASVSHPIFDGVNEYSPPNRPYRGPAIVSSDMANTGDT